MNADADDLLVSPRMAALQADASRYLIQTYNRWPIALDRGEGAWVWDVDGKQYLDFTSGIAVTALGHCHPAITEAIERQAQRLLHCSNLFLIPEQVALAKLLVENSAFAQAFFCNSGAEANEAAIKLARRYAQKVRGGEGFEILSFSRSFHGRTLATVTATAQPKYQDGFSPLPEGFRYLPFGDLEAVKAAIGPQTCGILVEPIQGEGGVHPATADFLQGLRRLCDEHDLVLIFDEVQTGIGRTGRLFAHEHYEGAVPDVVGMAKGLGGGVPIGGILISERVVGTLVPGTHASTFGGNPLVTSVSQAVVQELLKPGFLPRVREMGAFLHERLVELQEQFRHVTAVRGMGLLQGIELHENLPAAQVVEACQAQGLLLVPAGDNTIRFLPPLTVNRETIETAVSMFSRTMARLTTKRG
jgi:acetylornithine aminotransferase/acetylornithine/N-succinyldiaminopimelate aminotransferase